MPVDAGEDAIAINVGVDDRRHAGALETPGQLDDAEFGSLGPAFDRHLAENDPGETLFQPGFNMRQRTDTAAKLHRVFGRLEDCLDCGAIDRLTFEGAVEIDHMQPFKTLVLKRLGLGRGVLVVNRC